MSIKNEVKIFIYFLRLKMGTASKPNKVEIYTRFIHFKKCWITSSSIEYGFHAEYKRQTGNQVNI